MNLKSRFLILTTVLFLISALASWWVVNHLSRTIVLDWAKRYTETQVLYDKTRTLQPILREIALSKQLANTPVIRRWARDPENPQLYQEALVILETYRQNFTDKSYFVALQQNLKYYHNNADNAYQGKEFRYVLDPHKTTDSWFFKLIEQKRDIHINVNQDIPLGITKLWIDVLIRDGSQILGMTGTGLDLTDLITTVVDSGEPGITSLFVDHNGAIQLHRNQQLIDFSTISKKQSEHKNIELIFTEQHELKTILAAMKLLETNHQKVVTELLHVKGQPFIAGVAYIPELDWYEITLIELDILLPYSSFYKILIIFSITLLLALISYNLILNRLVLNPLSRLDKAMLEIQNGKDPGPHLVNHGKGEIKRLIEQFRRMATAIIKSQNELESKVRERTEALEQLAKIDPLTNLLNRRGLMEQLTAEYERICREKQDIGIFWLDVDHFKQINDQYGHDTGDKALQTVASHIKSSIRPYDLCGRWGGDEFLVAMHPVSPQSLEQTAGRILESVNTAEHFFGPQGEPIVLSVSIGGYISFPGEKLESIIHNADENLYKAKQAGRNCYHI